MAKRKNRLLGEFKDLIQERISVAHVASLLKIPVEQLKEELAADDPNKIAHLIVDVSSDDLSVYFEKRWDTYKADFSDILSIRKKLNTSLNLIYDSMVNNPGWLLIQHTKKFFLLISTFSFLEKDLGYWGEPVISKKEFRKRYDVDHNDFLSICLEVCPERVSRRNYLLKSDADKISAYIENVKKKYCIKNKGELCAELNVPYHVLDKFLSQLNISFKETGFGYKKGITHEEYDYLSKQIEASRSQNSLNFEESTEESNISVEAGKAAETEGQRMGWREMVNWNPESYTQIEHNTQSEIVDVTDRLPSLEKSVEQTETEVIELNETLSVEPISSDHEVTKLQQQIQFLQWQVESLTKDKEYFQNLCFQFSKGQHKTSEPVSLLDDQYPELNKTKQSQIADPKGVKIKMNLSQLQREFGCGWNRLLKMLETLMLNPDLSRYEKGKRTGRILGPVDIERMRILHEVEDRGCATLEETRKMLSLTENRLAELLQRFSIETVEDGMGTKLMDYRDFLLLSKNLSQTVNKAIAQEIDSEKTVSQTAIKRLQDLNQKTSLSDFNTHYRGNLFEGKKNFNAEELEELLMREYSQYENKVFRKEINDENCAVLQSAAEKMVEEFRVESQRIDSDQILSLSGYWQRKMKNPTTGNDRLLLKASLGYLLLNEEISLRSFPAQSGPDHVYIHTSA